MEVLAAGTPRPRDDKYAREDADVSTIDLRMIGTYIRHTCVHVCIYVKV